jgi:hypothetical protein
MKKTLIAVAAVAIFSLGLALYANKSVTNAVIDNNIEALAQNGSDVPGGGDYTETEDYILYHSLNKLFVKHGSNKTWLWVTLNTCESEGSGCMIDLGSQSDNDRTDNTSWARSITNWIISAAKEVVIHYINNN